MVRLTNMRLGIVVLVAFLSYKGGEVGASEISKSEVKEKENLFEVDKVEEESRDESDEGDKERRDMLSDIESEGVVDEVEYLDDDLEEDEEEEEELDLEEEDVTLESVRLGWDLFKEWQEVADHELNFQSAIVLNMSKT